MWAELVPPKAEVLTVALRGVLAGIPASKDNGICTENPRGRSRWQHAQTMKSHHDRDSRTPPALARHPGLAGSLV